MGHSNSATDRSTDTRWSGVTVFLVILLVMSGQYIITLTVNRAGGNAELVSHVSLAGTLISIVLALLTIVYTYFQTFTQQRDSASIATQIEMLRAVVGEARDSGVDFAAELNRLTQLSTKMDHAVELAESQATVSQSMASKIDAIQATAFAQVGQEASRHAMPPTAVPQLVDLLVERSTSLELTCVYITIRAAESHMKPSALRKSVLQPVVIQVASVKLVAWVSGTCFGIQLMLASLRIVTFEEASMRASAELTAAKGRIREALLARPVDYLPLALIDARFDTLDESAAGQPTVAE